MRISDWSSDVCSSDLQLAGRSVIGEPPFVEQQHAVAAFGFVEIGGRPDYGHPFVGQRLHHAPQILTADRIDTDTRFIEQQDSRPGHQCAGETQLLLHAAGERASQASRSAEPTYELPSLMRIT